MVDKDLLAYLEDFLTPERLQRFLDVLDQRTRYLTVAVEDVYQLHNTSAILRSCDVFGIQDLHLVEASYGKRLDKNIALGAEKWVDCYSYTDTPSCIQALRESGYEIVATVPDEAAIDLREFEIEGKMVLFFGTEKEGLSKEVLEAADRSLKIPMVGFSESLNVSVSAAIILHHLSGLLRAGSWPWQLSGEERLDKRFDWAKKTIHSVDAIIARYEAAR